MTADPTTLLKISLHIFSNVYKIIFQGLKQEHDHIGNISKYKWAKEACLEVLLTHPRDC